MKKLQLILCLGLMMAGSMSFAQIKSPAASPFSTLEQKVGLTDVSIAYSRPSMKDRDIFSANGLVPFGKLWRTGANSATKISFSTDVKIEGQELGKGSYAVLTVPNATTWDINFYKHTSSRWSTYKEVVPDLSVKVNPLTFPPGMKLETFLITIGNLSNEEATIEILWDNIYVPVKLWVGSDAAVMSNIERVLSGPSKGDYYTAANYYHSAGKDLNKAYEFITKATEGEDKKFWQVRRQALIEADLGKYDKAIKTAELSIELATKAENMEYVKMNKASIGEWSTMK